MAEAASSSKIKATPEFGAYVSNSGVDFLPLSQEGAELDDGLGTWLHGHLLGCRSSAHVAQSVEHILGKDEVTGSNPVMGLLAEEVTARTGDEKRI